MLHGDRRSAGVLSGQLGDERCFERDELLEVGVADAGEDRVELTGSDLTVERGLGGDGQGVQLASGRQQSRRRNIAQLAVSRQPSFGGDRSVDAPDARLIEVVSGLSQANSEMMVKRGDDRNLGATQMNVEGVDRGGEVLEHRSNSRRTDVLLQDKNINLPGIM